VSGGGLDGGSRFENFVVGASNRLAFSAAQRVAEAPGTDYNPLFIYGGSGLGKTHLAAAIAYHARQAHPALRVDLASAEDIVERLTRAIASGQREQVAAPFQQLDLLLIDDVQFLTGQRETQSELLRLVNQMQAGRRQLVMTSDRPPVEIPDVDERLVSRLSGGLVVDVGAPDFEMCLAILRNAAAERGLRFEDGVLEVVARLAFGNVRELKGALNRLAAFQQLEESPIGAADVRAILGDRRAASEYRVSAPVEPPAEERVRRAPAEPRRTGDLLADVAPGATSHPERWRVTLGEAGAFWRSEGYETGMLDRALQRSTAPDVHGLLSTFAAAVEHLRGLEMQAVTLDPGLRGNPAFRDPELVADAQRLLDVAVASALPLPAPDPTCTRERLEAGRANQLAIKAADAVIAEPGARYNPLFIHGATGTGKSHLAHAIALAIRAARPRAAITCVAAGAFVEEFVAAMQEGGVDRWRARYRAAEVFVLDDVQQLADKERTQEELFHLFNGLIERGAQVVLTCDRVPRDVRGLADRLRSRFEAGLVVALQPPDRGLRAQLVRRWLEEAGQPGDPMLVAYLADRDVAGARELAALITRLAAAADLLAVPLDLPLARRELEGIASPAAASLRGGNPAGDVGHDAFFSDREKVCWEWPDLVDRVAEEWR
jgi:chromosomal replication initiator protein